MTQSFEPSGVCGVCGVTYSPLRCSDHHLLQRYRTEWQKRAEKAEAALDAANDREADARCDNVTLRNRVAELEAALRKMSAPMSPCPGCGSAATEAGHVRYLCHVCDESYIADTPAQIAGCAGPSVNDTKGGG